MPINPLHIADFDARPGGGRIYMITLFVFLRDFVLDHKFSEAFLIIFQSGSFQKCFISLKFQFGLVQRVFRLLFLIDNIISHHYIYIYIAPDELYYA